MDIRLALSTLGDGWDIISAIQFNTEEEWDSIIWNDSRTKPTWSELEAAYAQYSLMAAINEIEQRYAAKEASLVASETTVSLADGPNEAANKLVLQTKWASLQDAKMAEQLALMGG